MYPWGGRLCRRAGRRAGCAALLLAGSALLLARAPLTTHLQADFPHHAPDRLAHFLADFTNHPKLYTHISGPWQVEEEQSNLTWWRYVVSYECGARCGGRVALSAGEAGRAPAHAPTDARALEHRLVVRDERCTRAPLLPWLRLCEETNTETLISPRAGGGARLRERRETRCTLLAALLRACGAPDTRQHLRTLRGTLAAGTQP